MNFDLISFGLGALAGVGVSLAIGRAKFATVQLEAREQIESLEQRLRDMTAAAAAGVKKVTRKR